MKLGKRLLITFIFMIGILTFHLISSPSVFQPSYIESHLNWNDFKLTNLKIEQNEKNRKLLTLSNRQILSPLIELDFEGRSKLGNIDSNNSFRGKSSARFNGKSDVIEIPKGKSSLFKEPEIREPFYISFFVNPSSQSGSATLLNKSIFRSGQEFGFRLNLEQGRLELWVDRMIMTESENNLSVKLTSNHGIPARKWSHVILEFSPTENQLVLYINGLETGRYNGLGIPRERVTGFSFHPDDTSPLYLGKNFYGNIDEFLIALGKPNANHIFTEYDAVDVNLDSKVVSQTLGIALSPVYRTTLSHSYLSKFSMEAKEPKNTFVEAWFRSSLEAFGAYESEYKSGLSWKRLTQKDIETICTIENSKSKIDNPCFSYYQWKFIFRADPQGLETPSLADFHYKINHSLPPKQVTGLKFSESNSNLEEAKVCMTWVASEEANVWNGGGYILYYGFKENEVSGTIHYHNANNRKKDLPISLEKLNLKDDTKSTRVSIISSCVDNSILMKNAEDNIPENNIPYLRPGLTVFFWVSATNLFWTENGPGKDQISPKSKAIAVTIPTKGQ